MIGRGGNDFFDNVDRLRRPATLGFPNAAPRPGPEAARPKPARIAGEFLKGPIPLTWLTAASRLGGKAPLAVGLAVWFEAGRRRSREVRLTTAILSRFSVNRKAKYRALEALEAAGLVSVRREARRNPVVTILDAPTPMGCGGGDNTIPLKRRLCDGQEDVSTAQTDPAGSDGRRSQAAPRGSPR